MGSAGSFLNPTKALLEAAKRGDMEAIKKLFKAPTDVNCSDEKGRTPLHEAAWWGRADAARALLEQGANVNAVTKRGWAPLRILQNITSYTLVTHALPTRYRRVTDALPTRY